jgi:hypothetical protein
MKKILSLFFLFSFVCFSVKSFSAEAPSKAFQDNDQPLIERILEHFQCSLDQIPTDRQLKLEVVHKAGSKIETDNCYAVLCDGGVILSLKCLPYSIENKENSGALSYHFAQVLLRLEKSSIKNALKDLRSTSKTYEHDKTTLIRNVKAVENISNASASHVFSGANNHPFRRGVSEWHFFPGRNSSEDEKIAVCLEGSSIKYRLFPTSNELRRWEEQHSSKFGHIKHSFSNHPESLNFHFPQICIVGLCRPTVMSFLTVLFEQLSDGRIGVLIVDPISNSTSLEAGVKNKLYPISTRIFSSTKNWISRIQDYIRKSSQPPSPDLSRQTITPEFVPASLEEPEPLEVIAIEKNYQSCEPCLEIEEINSCATTTDPLSQNPGCCNRFGFLQKTCYCRSCNLQIFYQNFATDSQDQTTWEALDDYKYGKRSGEICKCGLFNPFIFYWHCSKCLRQYRLNL